MRSYILEKSSILEEVLYSYRMKFMMKRSYRPALVSVWKRSWAEVELMSPSSNTITKSPSFWTSYNSPVVVETRSSKSWQCDLGFDGLKRDQFRIIKTLCLKFLFKMLMNAPFLGTFVEMGCAETVKDLTSVSAMRVINWPGQGTHVRVSFWTVQGQWQLILVVEIYSVSRDLLCILRFTMYLVLLV
jgi:hypothetical protein